MLSILSAIPSEAWLGLMSAMIGMLGGNLEQRNRILLAHLKGSTQAAAEAQHRGGKYVRRALAVMAGAYLFVWPALVYLLSIIPGVDPVAATFMWPETRGVFFWASDRMMSAQVEGLPITPVHTHLASAVFFFYFGAGVVKR